MASVGPALLGFHLGFQQSVTQEHPAGHPRKNLKIQVVLNDDDAARTSFERCFGVALDPVYTNGFNGWADSS